MEEVAELYASIFQVQNLLTREQTDGRENSWQWNHSLAQQAVHLLSKHTILEAFLSLLALFLQQAVNVNEAAVHL